MIRILLISLLVLLASPVAAKPPVQWQRHEAICQPGSVAVCSPVQPKLQLWVCFVNSRADSTLGTIGWSTSRLGAELAAEELCVVEFGSCAVEYCESLTLAAATTRSR